MSDGIVYSITRADLRGAIDLLGVLASNKIDTMWCEGSGPPAKRTLRGAETGICGHSDDWYCAAEAIGVSLDSVWLAIAADVRVHSAWSDLDVRKEEGLVALGPRSEPNLYSSAAEAAQLLREGWLPSDYRLARKYQRDRGEYIPLHWEYGDPETYYVRGHVEQLEFEMALSNGLTKPPPVTAIRHGHAFWALNGRDRYGNAERTLCECSGVARGCFAVTAMDVHVDENSTQKPTETT